MIFEILGGGEVGSVVGAYLSVDHEVTLYCHGPHLDAIRQKGLRVSGVKGDTIYQIEACDTLSGREFDLGILAVKVYDNENLFCSLEEQGVQFARITSIQNGLKDRALIERFGIERVLGSVIDEAARMVEPGHVEHTGSNCSYFGPFYSGDACSWKREVGGQLAATLERKGLVARVSEDLELVTLYKLMGGTTAAVTGALDLDLRQRFLNSYASDLFVACVEEIRLVAVALHLPLESHPMLSSLFVGDEAQRKAVVERLTQNARCQEGRAHVPSLVQDLRAGKIRTEADTTIGAMLALGREKGVAMPVTEVCYRIIKVKEYENALRARNV